MTRVKRGAIANKRRKKILNFSESYRGSHSKLFTTANQQYMKALSYAYNDRRKNKKQFRKLWIQRINALSVNIGLKYNQLINKLKNKNIILNRKMMAKIALEDPNTFSEITKKI